jgi:hypothetical protein
VVKEVGPLQGCQTVYFHNKSPNFGIFRRPWSEKILVIFKPFGVFYGKLEYCKVIWYILWSFGIFLTVLACCTKTNLATLHLSSKTSLTA